MTIYTKSHLKFQHRRALCKQKIPSKSSPAWRKYFYYLTNIQIHKIKKKSTRFQLRIYTTFTRIRDRNNASAAIVPIIDSIKGKKWIYDVIIGRIKIIHLRITSDLRFYEPLRIQYESESGLRLIMNVALMRAVMAYKINLWRDSTII